MADPFIAQMVGDNNIMDDEDEEETLYPIYEGVYA